MTNPRYLPPGAADMMSKYKPWSRVLVETLPGVRVTAGGHGFVGSAVIDVPTDEVDKLMAKVRDHDEWARCEAAAKRKRDKEIAEGKRGDKHTAAAEFFSRHGKGGGSLARVEVIEDSIPAPLTDEERKLAQVMASVQSQMTARVAPPKVEEADASEAEDVEVMPRRRGRPRKVVSDE
jgi:hypothetical protein